MSNWIEYTQEDEQESGRAYYDYWYEEEMRDDDGWKEEKEWMK